MQRIHQLIWYLSIFFVPISIPKEIGGGFSLSFPSEILILVCGLLGLLTDSPAKSNTSLFRNPITWMIITDLGIMALTTLTSVQPEISVKRFVMRALVLWVFYVQGAARFQSEKEILRFWYCYISGMTVAVVYILIQHSQYHFAPNFAAEIPKPLFAEHAIYGACLAFLLPFLAIRWLKGERLGNRKWIWGGVFCLFLFAEYAAASRAAWIGLVVAIGIFFILIFRFRWWKIAVFMGILVLGINYYQQDISLFLSRNNAQSHNRNADAVELLASMANFQSDVSNMERLNRWGAASRMIADKPFLGFGPGTYQFQYAPYQVFSEITRISTREGNRGNAHSEYIMAWVESGILCFFTFLGIFMIGMYVGIRNVFNAPNERTKYIQMAALLGIITYAVHGLFNAFLDQDEASSLVWASLAMLSSGSSSFHTSQ